MNIESTAAVLDTYVPVDAQERDHLSRIKGLLANTSQPFSRHQFAPGHFTASAFVLSPCGGKLLLIFHGKLRRWLQPGGHVDVSDHSLLAVAERELLEETGLGPADVSPDLSPLLDVDVHVIPEHPPKREPSHCHFDVRFLFRARTETVAAGSDAQGVRWVPLLSFSTVETDESVLRAVRKIRQKVSP